MFIFLSRFASSLSNTRTGKARYIALANVTAKALEVVRKYQTERRLKLLKWNDRNLMFDSGSGRLIPAESLHWEHQLAIVAAGVLKIRLHDLRHSVATLMLKSGVALEVVSRMLGHASLAITADIYGHIDVSMQRSAADTLGELIKRKTN